MKTFMSLQIMIIIGLSIIWRTFCCYIHFKISDFIAYGIIAIAQKNVKQERTFENN